MKIIYQGDLHLRDRAPVNRVDNYKETQFNKLAQLVEFANKYEANLLLGGDIFDTHKVSAEIVNRANEALLKCKHNVFAVMGQHDVPYHDMDVIKSPVHSLELSGALVVRSDSTIEMTKDIIHFCGWEGTPPAIYNYDKENILLGHISVFATLPFYWKGEGYTPNTLKQKYPDFDYYLCGDIHEPLQEGRVIVSGSMLRSSINQADFRPRAYLIDTDIDSITPLFYQIEKEVFNIPEKKEQKNLKLDKLMDALKGATIGKHTYERDCLALSVEDEPVRAIIEDIFDDID